MQLRAAKNINRVDIRTPEGRDCVTGVFQEPEFLPGNRRALALDVANQRQHDFPPVPQSREERQMNCVGRRARADDQHAQGRPRRCFSVHTQRSNRLPTISILNMALDPKVIISLGVVAAAAAHGPTVVRVMKLPNRLTLKGVARKGRHALQDIYYSLRRRVRRPRAGEFQPYYYTAPDRYPWLFGFAATRLGSRPDLRILSFGCSRGEEVFSLRKYFPAAAIAGIDINPRNIARCLTRVQADNHTNMTFRVAATTQDEPTSSYDAIFCLAVLVNGD